MLRGKDMFVGGEGMLCWGGCSVGWRGNVLSGGGNAPFGGKGISVAGKGMSCRVERECPVGKIGIPRICAGRVSGRDSWGVRGQKGV